MLSTTVTTGQERRDRVDRRRVASSPFSLVVRHGRRRAARRAQDGINTCVDLYEARWFYAAVGVLLLSCTDAALTMNLLQQGASEINPFMEWLLNMDKSLFFLVKLALTAVGVVVLVAYKNFRLFNQIKAGHVLYAFLAGYALLVKYELVLLSA